MPCPMDIGKVLPYDVEEKLGELQGSLKYSMPFIINN